MHTVLMYWLLQYFFTELLVLVLAILLAWYWYWILQYFLPVLLTTLLLSNKIMIIKFKMVGRVESWWCFLRVKALAAQLKTGNGKQEQEQGYHLPIIIYLSFIYKQKMMCTANLKSGTPSSIIALSDIDSFSKTIYCHSLQTIRNDVIIKDPSTL